MKTKLYPLRCYDAANGLGDYRAVFLAVNKLGQHVEIDIRLLHPHASGVTISGKSHADCYYPDAGMGNAMNFSQSLHRVVEQFVS